MKEIGRVHGSAEMAAPLVIGKDTVYVHTDIRREDVDNGDGTGREEYSYHEVQYEKDEYIRMMAEHSAALEGQITDTQLALCEAYEMILGGI